MRTFAHKIPTQATKTAHPARPTGQDHRRWQAKRIEGGEPGEATGLSGIRDVLASAGQPLDLETRAFMEARFMHDFSRVRVHTDAPASRSADAVGARAYTVASDIAFRQGEYAPLTMRGKHLLAHELTHVIQQSRPQSSPTMPPTLRRSPLDDRGQDSQEPMPGAAAAAGITSPARINASRSPGWQSVDPQYLLIKKGEPVELPHALLLNYQSDKCAPGKTVWTVREGRYEGHDVCISTGALVAASSFAIGAAATAKFDIGKGAFWYGGTGPVEAFTDPDNPVPTGIHDIEIPDFHHDYGAKYGDYGTTWFRLGHSGDRYLHPGRVSLGCTTIKATKEWPNIWKYLIASRKDHLDVGTLEVVK